MDAGRARRTKRRASFGEALDDFAKSNFPRPHQGKWRPIRPAFLAKGRSDATEFENLNDLDARKAGNEPRGRAQMSCCRGSSGDTCVYLRGTKEDIGRCPEGIMLRSRMFDGHTWLHLVSEILYHSSGDLPT